MTSCWLRFSPIASPRPLSTPKPFSMLSRALSCLTLATSQSCRRKCTDMDSKIDTVLASLGIKRHAKERFTSWRQFSCMLGIPYEMRQATIQALWSNTSMIQIIWSVQVLGCFWRASLLSFAKDNFRSSGSGLGCSWGDLLESCRGLRLLEMAWAVLAHIKVCCGHLNFLPTLALVSKRGQRLQALIPSESLEEWVPNCISQAVCSSSLQHAWLEDTQPTIVCRPALLLPLGHCIEAVMRQCEGVRAERSSDTQSAHPLWFTAAADAICYACNAILDLLDLQMQVLSVYTCHCRASGYLRLEVDQCRAVPSGLCHQQLPCWDFSLSWRVSRVWAHRSLAGWLLPFCTTKEGLNLIFGSETASKQDSTSLTEISLHDAPKRRQSIGWTDLWVLNSIRKKVNCCSEALYRLLSLARIIVLITTLTWAQHWGLPWLLCWFRCLSLPPSTNNL